MRNQSPTYPRMRDITAIPLMLNPCGSISTFLVQLTTSVALVSHNRRYTGRPTSPLHPMPDIRSGQFCQPWTNSKICVAQMQQCWASAPATPTASPTTTTHHPIRDPIPTRFSPTARVCAACKIRPLLRLAVGICCISSSTVRGCRACCRPLPWRAPGAQRRATVTLTTLRSELFENKKKV